MVSAGGSSTSPEKICSVSKALRGSVQIAVNTTLEEE